MNTKEYDDNAFIQSKKGRQRIKDTPIGVLAGIYAQPQKCKDKKLVQFIEKNWPRIMESMAKGLPYIEPLPDSEKTPAKSKIKALDQQPQKKAGTPTALPYPEEKEYEICSETGKRMYSKREAHEAINYAKKNRGRNKKPIRSYQCEHCNFWHLTSTPNLKKGDYE